MLGVNAIKINCINKFNDQNNLDITKKCKFWSKQNGNWINEKTIACFLIHSECLLANAFFGF